MQTKKTSMYTNNSNLETITLLSLKKKHQFCTLAILIL